MSLTSAQRKILTRHGHGISPVVYIGKYGLTDEVVAAAAKALEDHELIKIRFVEWKKSREPFSRELAQRTNSSLVRVMGNTALLFKRQEDPEKRKYPDI